MEVEKKKRKNQPGQPVSKVRAHTRLKELSMKTSHREMKPQIDGKEL
jgi:hypothetical protein